MRFALSPSAYPAWDISTLVATAKRLGFEGVELRADSDSSNPSGADPLLTDPRRLHAMFQDAAIEPASLSTCIAMKLRRVEDAKSVALLRVLFDLASAIGCRCVSIHDAQTSERHSITDTMVRLENWLRPLGDEAARHAVTLAVENGPTLRKAGQIWKVLDAVDHPAIGCAWSLRSTLLSGESPTTSVSTLNSRIQLVRLDNSKTDDRPVPTRAPDLGDVHVEHPHVQRALHALMGIGYRGWVVVQLPAQPTPQAAEALLTAELDTLRRWTTPVKPAARAVKATANG